MIQPRSTLSSPALGHFSGPSAFDEADLVDKLLADVPSAWREFNARYSRLVLSRIQRIVSRFPSLGSEDVREIYASFCLQLLANDKRKLRLFQRERGVKLSTWLGVLTSNAAYDYLRALRREPCRGSVAEAEGLSSQLPDPAHLAEIRQKAEAVADLLAGLSERDQEFMMLYYGEGLSPEAIADLLGVSVKTVYSKKHKIRLRLETALGAHRIAA